MELFPADLQGMKLCKAPPRDGYSSLGFRPEKVHNHKKAENYGKSCVCLFSLHFELNECSHMCRKCLDTLFAPAYQQASQHFLPGLAYHTKQRGGKAFINYR